MSTAYNEWQALLRELDTADARRDAALYVVGYLLGRVDTKGHCTRADAVEAIVAAGEQAREWNP